MFGRGFVMVIRDLGVAENRSPTPLVQRWENKYMRNFISVVMVTVLSAHCISCSRTTIRNNQPAWSPKSKEVTAAMAAKDVKELNRLFIQGGSSEAHTVLHCNVDEWGKRKEWEDSLIKCLEHKDVTTVASAANMLGTMRCRRAVPALIAALESTGSMVKPWIRTEGELTTWGELNARESIIVALGHIGDRRAVDVLETFLSPPKHGVYPGNAAYALYEITGKRYRFIDHDGVEKVFRTSKQ